MVEEDLYGLALLVANLPLVVDLQAVLVERQHAFDLLVKVVLKDIYHVAFKGLHED